MLWNMSIRIQHGNVTYIVDTPEESVKLGTLLAQTEGLVQTEEYRGTLVGDISASTSEEGMVWTPELFRRFMERLGESQITALTLLAQHRYVSDELLRTQLGVEDNQALAGILSGISKQAIALGMSPRSVFSFENLRKTGKRSSIYSVPNSLREIALKHMALPK